MAKDLNRVPQFGLAIDWETSGYTLPNYTDRHQGISYGAIVFDMRTLEPIESLYQEIKFDPKKYSWSIEAEKVHGLTKPYLEAHGVTQEAAAFALVGLVSKYMGTEEVVLLGHRVHFDKAFTNQLLASESLALTYHPTVIDSCSIATVLMELTYSEDIFSTLGLPARGKHNSLEDIQYTLEAVKRMKEFFILGVAVSLQD